jgi:hypothetical protein
MNYYKVKAKLTYVDNSDIDNPVTITDSTFTQTDLDNLDNQGIIYEIMPYYTIKSNWIGDLVENTNGNLVYKVAIKRIMASNQILGAIEPDENMELWEIS